jgi:glycosyltransferase involved in cell wall biosynthesis
MNSADDDTEPLAPGLRHAADIAVVVPVRDEAESIDQTLRALLSQTLPPAEIIVVDGGSRDDTRARVVAVAATDPRVRLIEAGEATPGRGRNVGIESAHHEWIALTDAGAEVAHDWLEQLVAAAHRDPTARVVYGTYDPIADNFWRRSAALAYVAPRRAAPGGTTRGPATMSMLVHRDAWRRAGGFPDLRAAEDLLFFDRVAALGIPTVWAPGACVRWQPPRTPLTTFRRFELYSFHNVRAGLQTRWHYGVARQYVAIVALALLAVGMNARWWWAVAALLGVRTVRAIWRRHVGAPSLNPVYAVGVLCLLLIIDAATFAGWVRALRR